MASASKSLARSIALLAALSLAACGGSDNGTTAVQLPVGGGNPPFVRPACTPDRYFITLSSSSALASDEPQIMQLLVNCGGNDVVVPNVAVDWTVTAGGGTINGSTTARTMTAADGTSEVTWHFGSGVEVQSIEARLNGVTPSLHAALSRTILAAGPNPCAAAGGTDLGNFHTVSGDEKWTKAGSPYRTGEVTIPNGALLTIDPAVVVCVGKINIAEAGRIVAAGTAAEKIHFGLRDRSTQWEGMVFQAPSNSIPGASVLQHAVIENPSGIDASSHPIIVEDTLIRRDSALISTLVTVQGASGAGWCGTFAIRQHRLGGIAPSRVARTVIDGLGGPPGTWDDYGPGSGCPALRIQVSDETPPLVISARVINSWGPGVGVTIRGPAKGVSQTLLTDCEISGSAEMGLFVDAEPAADSLLRMTSCNVFGNAHRAVSNYLQTNMQFDARGNWWGDPAGPGGRQGNGVSGNVDASLPLNAPLSLGY